MGSPPPAGGAQGRRSEGVKEVRQVQACMMTWRTKRRSFLLPLGETRYIMSRWGIGLSSSY